MKNGKKPFIYTAILLAIVILVVSGPYFTKGVVGGKIPEESAADKFQAWLSNSLIELKSSLFILVYLAIIATIVFCIKFKKQNG